MSRGKKLDIQMTARDGREVRFEFHRDTDRENRGFVIDEVRAFIGDAKAGYLKAEYLCSRIFDAYYPTIFSYMSQISGQFVLPLGKETVDIRALSAEELGIVAGRLCTHRFTTDEPGSPFRDVAEFDDWFKNASTGSRRIEQVKIEFKEFKKRIDRPFVAYVNTKHSPNNNVEEDFSGLGIGTALYLVMGKELAKIGMTLRSSTLQSPYAKTIWNKLVGNGWTFMDDVRIALDANKYELEEIFRTEAPLPLI